MKVSWIWMGFALVVATFGCGDDDDGGSSVDVTMEDDDADDDEEGPSTPAVFSCPSVAPSEGRSCQLSGDVDCRYADEICNCIGLLDPTWRCRDAPMVPPNPRGNPDADDFDGDAGGGADFDAGAPNESDGSAPNASDAGLEPRPSEADASAAEPPAPEGPDPGNPETCPDESPPTDVCDIDAVGFGTECRYGLRTCVCGGFPGDGEWACVMEEPPVQNPESCPDDAPSDDVCDIDAIGFGTTCVYGERSCVCGGFPGQGAWQCSGEAPPQPVDASAPDPDADASD